jgi:hypothetical protein
MAKKKKNEKMLTIPGHKGNALRFYLTPVRIAIIKNTTTNKCWQGYRGKRNPHSLMGR